MRDVLNEMIGGATLTEADAERVFLDLLGGSLEEARVGALLALIQARGAAVDELVGAARAMRASVEPVPYTPADGERLLDTCGTGGAPKTFNVSTAAAIVAAAAGFESGLRVAKHGNRSRTGRGSAEVLQSLGVNIDASGQTQARCLRETGVCFCFAMRHHPAMRHAAGARKALGVPTIFNLLGPLTNPAGADRQLLGVYDRRFVEPVAQALARLGARRAMVVHGLDGLDEMTLGAPTLVAEVRAGSVATHEVDATSLGLARAEADALRAQDLDDAARIIRATLEGREGPALDIVLLNAAAALVVGDAVEDLASGVAAAREATRSGAAVRTLERLAAVSAG